MCSLLVCLHMLTSIYDGKFALVKRHNYFMAPPSDITKQPTANGGASSSSTDKDNTGGVS